MRSFVFWSLILLTIAAGCARRNVNYLKSKGIRVTASTTFRTEAPVDSIQLQYLGCGGVYIRHEGIGLMVDPFFSHQRFMRIGRSIFLGGKIRPMPRQLNFGRKMILDSLNISTHDLARSVQGIFSAHGHYDHFMDVPFIHHEWLNEKADVFANTSSNVAAANMVKNGKLHDIEKIASIKNQKGDSIVFANGHSIIRVYPIIADHNPHSNHIKLFAGSVVQTPARLNHYNARSSVNDWLEGQTLSFLFDFVKNDTIRFRMFLQSSTCQFPNGLPPENLLREKSVDLALLGIASYKFSENTFPCDFLEKLKPKKLMFIHWEDFFKPYDSKVKAMKYNDLPRFFNDIFSRCSMEYEMPVPGSLITVTH